MKLRKIAQGVALAGITASAAHAVAVNPTVTVKLLAFNDFHGQLESPGTLRLTAAASPTRYCGGPRLINSWLLPLGRIRSR